LKVAASSIEGSGIAKLDSDSFRKLKLADGTPVLVSYGTKTLELVAKPDTIFSESTVRLMREDIETLRVVVGMEVAVAKKNGNSPAEKPVPKTRKGKRGKKANAASLDSF
jgi:hypothetical protein